MSSSTITKTAKPGSYNVNASSMLSLLSEVSRHSDKHKRGSTTAGMMDNEKLGPASTKRSTGKTAAIFDRANRGIEARSASDRSHMLSRDELSEEARRVLESREKMEKKALLYEKLAKGEDLRGVSREQLREGLLVDFETKAIEEAYKGNASSSSSDGESDSDEADESRKVPLPPGAKGKQRADKEDDELVESTDDFGRTRWVRQSQLDKEAASQPRGSVIDDGVLPYYSNDIQLASHAVYNSSNAMEITNNDNVYYGDQVDFHVYQPSPEEILERRKRLKLDDPLNLHFDASKEIRNRGAGFIQLSADEETRKKQMEELKNERKETEEARAARESGQVVDLVHQRREKELSDRKRLVEEKRNQILQKRKAAELAREGSGAAAKKLKE